MGVQQRRAPGGRDNHPYRRPSRSFLRRIRKYQQPLLYIVFLIIQWPSRGAPGKFLNKNETRC
jgi:hypothetical protein